VLTEGGDERLITNELIDEINRLTRRSCRRRRQGVYLRQMTPARAQDVDHPRQVG
jgi:hypothetical protein